MRPFLSGETAERCTVSTAPEGALALINALVPEQGTSGGDVAADARQALEWRNPGHFCCRPVY